jgi:hypothetical protein
MSKTRSYNLAKLRALRDEIYDTLPPHAQHYINAKRQARADWYAWREAMKEAGETRRLTNEALKLMKS